MAFVTDPIGIIGEEEAAKMLKQKGLKVLEHNWRMGHLEVDLIAESKNEIIFVEVKARTSILNGKMPEQNVDETKKQRLTAAANAYIKQHQTNQTIRFDVIGFLIDPKTQEITYRNHIENAFHPVTRTMSNGSLNGSWKWSHRHKTIRSKH